MKHHSERAHSMFAASAAERWFECPGSIALNEPLPDVDTPWSKEGTLAHELKEAITLFILANPRSTLKMSDLPPELRNVPGEMLKYCVDAAQWLIAETERTEDAELITERRVYLSFIDPEMFGTLDDTILQHFGKLRIIDFKYGKGHIVSPIENLQLLFYSIGVAAEHHWNFEEISLEIYQPRAPNFVRPVPWTVTPFDLRYKWTPLFAAAVKRYRDGDRTLKVGSWCHWCKSGRAGTCPKKFEAKNVKAAALFESFELGTMPKTAKSDSLNALMNSTGSEGAHELFKTSKHQQGTEKEVRKAVKKGEENKVRLRSKATEEDFY